MTNIIPDCTLVTACFYTHDNNANAFDMKKIMENSEELLKMPCYLVVYGDNKTIPLLQELREKNGLIDLTRFITLELSDLWTYQYKDKINENRNLYWPTRDPRAQTDSHLINCNKCDFILQIINFNPFNTSKFCWIDCFLKTRCEKLCENYEINKILYVLNNITEKFHLQILNVCDKKYKQLELKREYYEQYRWIMCGCFFSCGKEIGVKVLTRLKQLFIETTEMGYGHGDELLFLDILDEFYDDIYRSYGDYGQILNNFIEPTRNIEYIYNMILNRYLQFGYHRECCDCAIALLKQIEDFKVQVSWDLYMKILFTYYASSYYYKPEDCVGIVNHIYSVCEKNPYMKNEFNKNAGFYMSQFKCANTFKERCELIICVFSCATVQKYKDEILKVEETWGKRAGEKGVKVLYFLGEEPTDLQDGKKYIYLKNVKNDYESASDKQNLGLKYIYENYNADYVFVCGSDTYVNIDKMLELIKNYNYEEPLYIGGHGDKRMIGEFNYYYHCGAGFILSRECLHLIYTKLWNMLPEWTKICNKCGCHCLISACDVAISYFLQNTVGDSLKIVTLDDEFVGCNHKGLANNNTFVCCGDKVKQCNIVICHRMTLGDFDEFNAILKGNKYFINLKEVEDNFIFNKTNTFCISAPSHEARWKKQEYRFKNTGLDAARWLAATPDNGQIVDKFCDWLKPLQKACSQSHLNIWKHLLNSNDLEYAFILEDDACFDFNWRQKMQQFFTDVNDPEWDMILLNASEPIEPINKWVKITEQYLTGGYILSKKGAKTMIQMFENNYAASDWMTSRLEVAGHSYSYFPWLIIQDGKESTISGNVDADHQKVLKCLSEINYGIENYCA
jgi:GR25 family glycosyltransferase involved in LPS biosynthesis